METLLRIAVVNAFFVTVGSASTDITCSTTAGDFDIQVGEEWSPGGVERFLQLVDQHFFDKQLMYRVIPGFLVQFGVAADPKVMKNWTNKRIPDEPHKRKFQHGTLSFAGAGQNSRSCHFFIAFKPNGERLGNALHETPIGQVISGFEVLDKIQENFKASGYQDLTFLQGKISQQGNTAAKDYPKLDRIHTCRRAKTASSSDDDWTRAQRHGNIAVLIVLACALLMGLYFVIQLWRCRKSRRMLQDGADDVEDEGVNLQEPTVVGHSEEDGSQLQRPASNGRKHLQPVE